MPHIILAHPAEHGCPTMQLSRAAADGFELHIGTQSQALDAHSSIRLCYTEGGWGPIWDADLTITVEGVSTQPLCIVVSFPDEGIADVRALCHGLEAFLGEVASRVGCTIHIEASSQSQGLPAD